MDSGFARSRSRPGMTGLLLYRRLWQTRFARLHHEGLIERKPLALDVGRRGTARFVPHVIADQGARDAELRIRLQIRIVGRVDLRDQRLEALLENQKMQVRRTEVVPLCSAQEIADRPVNRN